jgi:hypothetical protein
MALVDVIKAKIKNHLLQRVLVYAFSDRVGEAFIFLVFPFLFLKEIDKNKQLVFNEVQ